MPYPTPHGDKLRALLGNNKLPVRDRPRIRAALERYEAWKAEIRGGEGSGKRVVEPLVASLNRYKKSIDLDLVFDSADDFLYRQKGQLKIENTILEEFLPWLVGMAFSEPLAERDLSLGPTNAFSQLRFESNLLDAVHGGGMAVRSKNHDFAIARPLFLKASHRNDFSESEEATTHLAYLAAEIKTNLDKTMFQDSKCHGLRPEACPSEFAIFPALRMVGYDSNQHSSHCNRGGHSAEESETYICKCTPAVFDCVWAYRESGRLRTTSCRTPASSRRLLAFSLACGTLAGSPDPERAGHPQPRLVLIPFSDYRAETNVIQENWLRGSDSNRRPPGYEPDELPLLHPASKDQADL